MRYRAGRRSFALVQSERGRVRYAMTAAAVLGVVALVAWVGPDAILGALGEANLGLLAAGFAAYAFYFVLRGLRWQRLLSTAAPRATWPAATGLTAFGWLVSTFVPFKAGDVARCLVLARRERSPVSAVAGTVALERILDVIGLAFAASAGVGLAAYAAAPNIPAMLPAALTLVFVVPALAILTMFALANALRRRRRENWFALRLHEFLQGVDLLRRGTGFAPLLALTVGIVLAQIAMFTFTILALRPALPGILVVAGVPLFLLSFVIAFTPGHVGTYEAAFVAIYTILLRDPTSLLPTAIALHLLTILFVTLLGGAGFALYHLAPKPQPGPVPVEAGP